MMHLDPRAALLSAALAMVSAAPLIGKADPTGRDDAPTTTEIAKAGKLFAKSCSTCHMAPDPEHATDRAWLNQVKDTAWSSTPRKARVALIEFLKSTPIDLPEVVDSAQEADDDSGTLTVNFDAGDLFLRGRDGLEYRLSWKVGETDAQRPRTLPAGEYKLSTYRILGESDGQGWHISGTAPAIRTIEVEAGEEVQVEIDQAITLKRRMGERQVSAGVFGDKNVGLTIYRGQSRIDMGYRILSAEGEELASGSMRYG